MPDVIPDVLIAASLIVAALALIPLVRGRPTPAWLLGLLILVEAGLLVLAVLGFVNLGSTARAVDGVTFGAYLIGSLVVLPLAVLWARAERSRWGVGVLVVALLVVPVLIVRLNQIWQPNV